MKKMILTGFSFLFALTMLFAQEANPETKAKEMVAELTEKLTLVEEQQAPIEAIVLAKINGKMAIKADTTITPEEAQVKMKELNMSSHAKINELLTDEQKVAFAKYMEEKKAKKMEKTK